MDWLSSPIATESDPELVARLRHRDPAGAGELYERYGKLLFGLILNILGDRQDAEDLLAETFLKASNQVHSFDTNHIAIGSWLVILARNHALEFRNATQGGGSDPRNVSGLEATQLYSLRDEKRTDFLKDAGAQKAFTNFPEKDRVILELAWFEGMTFDEIAMRIGLNLDEVVASAKASLDRIREH